MSRTLLSLAGLTRFGNMTSGGALSAIFDENTGTTGWRGTSSGYAGVSFSTPQKIDSVDVVSASNGFDASGLTTAITLIHYAKQGAVPSSDVDGVELSRLGPFTDVNTQTTKTLVSSDATTEWDHTWVKVITGEWSVFSEVKVYGPDYTPATPPAPSEALRPIYRKKVDYFVPFMRLTAEVLEFRTDPIAIGESGAAEIAFHCDAVHRGNVTGYNGPVGIAYSVIYRYAADFEDLDAAPWLEASGVKGGFNISELNPEHYGSRSVFGPLALEPGYYQFSIRASAHSTASNLNGLAGIHAESGNGFNNFVIAVANGAELIPC